jgi:hypothetical protein
MIATRLGSCVEGLAFWMQCRQFYLHTPYRHPKLNKMVYRFKLGIFGKVTITTGLPARNLQIDRASNWKSGDGIQGESISGFTAGRIPHGKLKPATSSHKATFIPTSDHSYARIDVPLRALLQKTTP